MEDTVTNQAYKEIEKAAPATPQKADNRKITQHLPTNLKEIDLVFGGGIAAGALTLLGGAPGIGKSTLTLQIAAHAKAQTLIISAEESANQVISRLQRLKLDNDQIEIISENSLEIILSTLHTHKPTLAIVDSVQTLYSSNATGLTGSPSQTRHITEQLLQLTKDTGISIILIGHVTKEGALAGPRTLEHLVDAVFLLEGDRHQNYRLLRGIKNRFGATDEVAVLEMTGQGLREVKNPSEVFLAGRHPASIGSVITPVLEGNRAFLMEIQALTSPTAFGYPRRTSSGLNLNRLEILIAVLQRYCGINLQKDDIFLNVVGGFKIGEHASDLAATLAIASSKKKKPLPEKLIALGEIGLSGELRPIQALEKRLKEAEKMGFTDAIIPTSSEKIKTRLKLSTFSTVNDVLKHLFR